MLPLNRSVICIPTIHRPEFLALCLEKLSLAPEAGKLDFRIFVDTCTDERLLEIEYCRDVYLPWAQIYRAGNHISVLSGCWNILNALKQGYESGADFIFLVEEDVFIAPKLFFNWHLSKHLEDDYAITCGRRINKFLPFDFYSNPGTCFSRKFFAHVIPHINDEFFSDPREYLDVKKFPIFRGQDGPLDDGLIRKVQKFIKGKVMCAEPRVASHCGMNYYGRLEHLKNKGVTIQEKIEDLKRILNMAWSAYDRYTTDLEPLSD